MRLKYFNRYLFIVPFLLCFGIQGFAQHYGVAFNSHDNDQDKRTSLNLTPETSLNLGRKFTIDFDLSFAPHRLTYFGYVFRLVGENNTNIDLLYNERQFKIVLGDKLLDIGIDKAPDQLFNKWIHFKISFDGIHQTISLSDGKNITQKASPFPEGNSFKLFFGGNNFGQFRTTDVPPMSLKDIKISVENKVIYYWPLDEYQGTVAHEQIKHFDGAAENPVWIAKQHYQWELLKNFTVGGVASVAFNRKQEVFYIVSADSLIAYSENPALQKTFHYKDGPVNFLPSNQSIFGHYKLYNFNVNQRLVSEFDFTKQTWDKNFDGHGLIDYWQANKFISAKDSALYILGGYGHLEYTNEVQRHGFSDQSWSVVAPKGDVLTPRYLAALGTTAKGDTAYILGGYGSTTGKQMINPQSFYDLIRFTVSDHRFKRLFRLKNNDDFALANSLIINEKTHTYYGLIFSPHRSNSQLQLIEGSLLNPDYHLLGSPIPYPFRDTRAFADLYYCPKTGKFVAVTLFRDKDEGGHTEIRLYSLLSPAEALENNKEIHSARINLILLYSIIFIVVLAASFVLVWMRKKRTVQSQLRTEVNLKPESLAEEKERLFEVVDAPLKIVHEPASSASVVTQDRSAIKQGAVYLFGGLQLISADEADLNVHFTPLLKELFLLILLYTIRWKNGVSSETLNELLWFDKSEQSAKNNRSVNIAKLKMILELVGNCHISKDSGSWKINFDPKILYVDYYNYLQLVANKKNFTKEKILALVEITQRGNFLTNIEYEWLDTFKSEVAFEVVDIYMHYINSVSDTEDPELMIKLSNHILYFDPVHEEAIEKKCKILTLLGNHVLAKNALESYKKEYFKTYNEPFVRGLDDILKQ